MTLQNLHQNVTKMATSIFDKEDVAFYSANINENGSFNISITVNDKDKFLEHEDLINNDLNDFILTVREEIKKRNY